MLQVALGIIVALVSLVFLRGVFQNLPAILWLLLAVVWVAAVSFGFANL